MNYLCAVYLLGVMKNETVSKFSCCSLRITRSYPSSLIFCETYGICVEPCFSISMLPVTSSSRILAITCANSFFSSDNIIREWTKFGTFLTFATTSCCLGTVQAWSCFHRSFFSIIPKTFGAQGEGLGGCIVLYAWSSHNNSFSLSCWVHSFVVMKVTTTP